MGIGEFGRGRQARTTAGDRRLDRRELPDPGYEPLGVRRLLENGAADPGFQRFVGGVRTLIVEREGTLLVGNPPIRLDEDGRVRVRFERPGGAPNDEPNLSPYRWVQLPDGPVVGHVHLPFGTAHQLVRWKPDGRWDTNFSCIVGLQRFDSRVQSVALLPDASVILSTASTSTTNPRTGTGCTDSDVWRPIPIAH